MYNKFQTYNDKVLLFPSDDFLTTAILAESPELKFTRLETLKKLKNDSHIIITNLTGYLKFLNKNDNSNEYELKTGNTVNRAELIKTLEKFGYNRESTVTSTGEYALRGMILDIFLIHEEKPIRIELDGNLVEQISYFDESTQLTNNEINNITINPVSEIKSNKVDSILNYMNEKNVFFYDYNQLKASYKKLCEDIFEYQLDKDVKEKQLFELEELKPKFEMYINTIDKSSKDILYNASEIINYEQNFEKLITDVQKWKKLGKKVMFCLSKDKQIAKIKEILPEVRVEKVRINQGFILDDLVVINDIEKTKDNIKEYKSSYKFGKKVKSYNQLEIGDYVVHVSHGIGIYNGLTKLSKNGVEKDFIQILYAGKDKIYVPVEKITSIYKYSDKDGSIPKINKLNGDTWSKTKRYIESKIKDISLELMDLYKKRLSINSDKYISYPEEKLFDEAFEHKLTSNQASSVNDIITDLSKSYPMDRLLCGDVGFGKTEVAFRAMFNTVLNNKQVMYLCPTTILSNQQYKVALERFKEWPIEIALLNRFVTSKKVKEILLAYEKGKIDILFGTHRILSDDIKSQKLGLLVVDEEQRFGVTHKEKIKSLKNDVNVLTLSATPIPRTLKMALSGIRDLSVIDTPPVNRYPIQTYVINENDLLIKDAIYKELSRDGQVFILYNRVEDIELQTNKIKKLIPDANISFAHGQMKKEELENIMNSFINHEFDILVCTTIIESGIDIPNVNTLLVYDADHFGLSQLYQIRGRVGRSNKIGYAYLLYKEGKILNEIATKRLKAIKEFTELGSGYKIAMRDLAIRGAGDVFGSSQAGFVDSVGISLYLKMIDDELKRQRGEEVLEEEEKQSLIDVETHISDEYVSDEDIKIEIHQLINSVNSFETFKEIKSKLENRFGKLPKTLEIYMLEEWFESLAEHLNIKSVKKDIRNIEIIIPKEVSENIKGDKLLMNAFQISTNFNIKYTSGQIFITLLYKNLEKHFLVYIIKLLEKIKEEL